MPNNYGDVALSLPPDWDRARVVHSPLINKIVGHSDGVSDLDREDDPGALHQFQWLNAVERDKLSIAKTKGYKFVRKSEGWRINNDAPFEWDAEGFVENDTGDRGMFRPASLYRQDQERMKEEQKRFRRQAEQEDERAERAVRQIGGDITYDEDERPLKRAGAGGRRRRG